MSGIWDLSLSKERTTHDIHVVDLGATSISVREPEIGTAASVVMVKVETLWIRHR